MSTCFLFAAFVCVHDCVYACVCFCVCVCVCVCVFASYCLRHLVKKAWLLACREEMQEVLRRPTSESRLALSEPTLALDGHECFNP